MKCVIDGIIYHKTIQNYSKYLLMWLDISSRDNKLSHIIDITFSISLSSQTYGLTLKPLWSLRLHLEHMKTREDNMLP